MNNALLSTIGMSGLYTEVLSEIDEEDIAGAIAAGEAAVRLPPEQQ